MDLIISVNIYIYASKHVLNKNYFTKVCEQHSTKGQRPSSIIIVQYPMTKAKLTCRVDIACHNREARRMSWLWIVS